MSELRRRAAGEEGFVMVVTVVVMALALVITGVAISDTVSARHITEKDRRGASAQQAADAGLQIAMYRANQMNLGTTDFNSGLSGLTNTLSCVVPGLDVNGNVSALTKVALGVSTACPNDPSDPGTPKWKPERLGNRTTFAYQFIPGGSSTGGSSTAGHASLNPVIVSIGYDDGGTTSTSDDVIRRVEAILNPVDPFNMIEATGNLSFSGGLTTVLNGDVRTNGNLSVGGLGLVGANVLGSDGALLRLANVQYGGTFSGVLTVASKVKTTSSFTRTPVSISSSKVDCWNGSGAQGTAGVCPSSTYYNSGNHRLTVGSGQTLTLGGGDFVFCSVSVASGGTLNTSLTSSSPTRIFIDNPNGSRCGGSTGNLSLLGNLNTVNVNPSQLQIYMTGNGTAGGTTATINTALLSGTPAFFLYAPDTNVTMTYTLFTGNIIGHDVAMNGYCVPIPLLGGCLLPSVTNVLTQDLGLFNMPLSASVGVFTRKQYIQCTPVEPVATNPTKDC
jgi:Tfp pilus assembly protein PilX